MLTPGEYVLDVRGSPFSAAQNGSRRGLLLISEHEQRTVARCDLRPGQVELVLSREPGAVVLHRLSAGKSVFVGGQRVVWRPTDDSGRVSAGEWNWSLPSEDEGVVLAQTSRCYVDGRGAIVDSRVTLSGAVTGTLDVVHMEDPENLCRFFLSCHGRLAGPGAWRSIDLEFGVPGFVEVAG